MRIQMIAGPRNEELIAKMKELRENDYDEMYDYFDELICDYGESVAYDTLYYACEDGDEMLTSQTAYFEYMLFNDEREYYVERMLHDLTRKEWLENTISAAENAIGEGRGFAAEYRIWYSGIRADKHIIFAINQHEDGWEYFVLDSKYRSIEDGIYDNPDMPIGEVLRILFEEFDIPGHEHIQEIVDYDEVIARYETQMRQNEYTCCICGKPSYGYGNNPDPVNIETGARCCDICNYGMVLPARIERMKAGLPMRLVN